MKKVLALLLCVVILIGLTACTYKGYSGAYSDLYTVAINSVLWNNGHSFSADKYQNSQIQIIEKDMYGRTMFTYYEKYYAGASISFSALIVCQTSNEKEVFYYEDVCYIVKEQTLYAQTLVEFETEEIENLKKANDWNKELNFDKCIKKEITQQKPAIPYRNDVEKAIVSQFHLEDEQYSLFVNFLTSNFDNSHFIIYGYIWENETDGTAFIGIVQRTEKSITNIKFLVPSNAYNYKTEFMEFKHTNQWT